MEKWAAHQIDRGGAYAGRTVEFETDDGQVKGHLDLAVQGAIYAYLVVDGTLHTLTKMTPVTVF
jgi:hypothetical protein